MHGSIGNHDESPGKDGQTHDIVPIGESVETKSAQNRSTGYLNIQAILVIDQCQESDLVDDKGLKTVVEDGELWMLVSVDKIPSKEDIRMGIDSRFATTKQMQGSHHG